MSIKEGIVTKLNKTINEYREASDKLSRLQKALDENMATKESLHSKLASLSSQITSLVAEGKDPQKVEKEYSETASTLTGASAMVQQLQEAIQPAKATLQELNSRLFTELRHEILQQKVEVVANFDKKLEKALDVAEAFHDEMAGLLRELGVHYWAQDIHGVFLVSSKSERFKNYLSSLGFSDVGRLL